MVFHHTKIHIHVAHVYNIIYRVMICYHVTYIVTTWPLVTLVYYSRFLMSIAGFCKYKLLSSPHWLCASRNFSRRPQLLHLSNCWGRAENGRPAGVSSAKTGRRLNGSWVGAIRKPKSSDSQRRLRLAYFFYLFLLEPLNGIWDKTVLQALWLRRSNNMQRLPMTK